MKVAPQSQPAAFAVVVVMVVVMLLTLIAGAFAYAMKVESHLAASSNDDEQFYWMGRAGVERACWWLAIEGNQPFSSKLQYWNHGPGDGPETNSLLAFESLDNYTLGQGSVSLKLVELESKLNINTADPLLLQHVLEQQGVDAGLITSVSDSIQDWIDPDDSTRPAGAESDYYQGKGGYDAKNGPLDNIDELQLIQGITPAMFTGVSETADNRPFARHKMGFSRAGDENYTFGLRDVFTPFSNGKVNLLTADENVLQLLPGVDTSAAQAIATARDSDPPIRNVGQLLAAAGIEPAAAAQFQRYLDVRGNTYEVHVTATIGQLSHEYVAIAARNGNRVDVYNFYRVK
jgi:type II secretory pathway component PulK